MLPAREGSLPFERHVTSKANVPRCSPSSVTGKSHHATALHAALHHAGCFSEAVSFVTHPLRPPQGRAASDSRERVPYIVGPYGSPPPTLACSTTAQHCRTAAQSDATELCVLQQSTTLLLHSAARRCTTCLSAAVQPVATQCSSSCSALQPAVAQLNSLQLMTHSQRMGTALQVELSRAMLRSGGMAAPGRHCPDA